MERNTLLVESQDARMRAKAQAIAREIVMRTNQTMRLEGQEISMDKLAEAIELRTAQIIKDHRALLWE